MTPDRSPDESSFSGSTSIRTGNVRDLVRKVTTKRNVLRALVILLLVLPLLDYVLGW